MNLKEELREELIERIARMDHTSLERVKSVLDKEQFDHAALPDVRVKRSVEQVSAFKQLLHDLAQPDEDLSDFNARLQRQPLRTAPLEFEP
jgi:hypothetical protein